MERWAAGKYKDQAHFLCISCAGPQLAQQMGARSGLQCAVNGYLEDPSSMVRWGQLGCNGFIVLDSRLGIASPCTAAFMQDKHGAFSDLEAVLDAELRREGIATVPAQPIPRQHSQEELIAAQHTGPITVKSVNHAEMDLQHERCVAGFAALQETCSLESLQQLICVLEEHFSCEERLMDQLLYSERGGEGGFSAETGARKSHWAEHARMLREARQQLADGVVSAAFVATAVREFEEHSELYDSVYAAQLV